MPFWNMSNPTGGFVMRPPFLMPNRSLDQAKVRVALGLSRYAYLHNRRRILN